jgi:hypothetical protein
LLTRQEKEKLVIDLYKQGKTIREIAKEVHMSFGDIGALAKREFGSEELEISKDTQALKLFAKGTKAIDIAIKLNMPPSQVERLHKEYRSLTGMDELNKIYEELGPNIDLLAPPLHMPVLCAPSHLS